MALLHGGAAGFRCAFFTITLGGPLPQGSLSCTTPPLSPAPSFSLSPYLAVSTARSSSLDGRVHTRALHALAYDRCPLYLPPSGCVCARACTRARVRVCPSLFLPLCPSIYAAALLRARALQVVSREPAPTDLSLCGCASVWQGEGRPSRQRIGRQCRLLAHSRFVPPPRPPSSGRLVPPSVCARALACQRV